MTDQELLKKAIDWVYAYSSEEAHDNRSLSSFVGYLNVQVATDGLGREHREENTGNQYTTASDELGISLVLLQRYAKAYVKRALKDTPISTGDEFSFLMALFVSGSHTKTELINEMVLSKTSGIEVIKRLRKYGYIREYNDPEDKRSKRVEITAEGKRLVKGLLPRMSLVSEAISGNLSPSELRTLNFLLKKLEAHHRTHFDSICKDQMEHINEQ